MFKRYAFSISTAVSHALLVTLSLAFGRPAAAQAPAWQSARAVAVATAAANTNYSDVLATAVDAAGNVYLAGFFTNTVALGSTTLTSLGGTDIFVAKFNPVSNQFVWAQRAGGTGYETATALAVSGTSVYVAGAFDGPTTSFGPATLTTFGSTDVFVAKLTDAGSTGSFVWAQRTGGLGVDRASSVAVSGGSVYVAGYFSGSAAGSYDAIIAKLTDAGSTGSFIWTQALINIGAEAINALAVSGGSVYMAGYFSNSTVSVGATTLTNAGRGTTDVFVAKLTDAGSTGSFVWAQSAGGAGNDQATALAVSGTNVYVAGLFSSPTVGFGGTILTNANVGASNNDMFVAKLTDAGPTGSFGWAQRAGSTGDEKASALAVSGSSVYVAGAFNSPTVNFGPTTLTNVGDYNMFVAKLTDTGGIAGFAWAQQAGGSSIDLATTLAVSGSSVYVAGYFISPTVSFGTTALVNPTQNQTLGFLAALTDPTLTATAAGHALAPAQLFPNPAHRTATLRLPAGTVPAPLILTDALGRAVRRYPAPAGSAEAVLDLQGVPAGLYLLRGAGSAQRLVVE